MNVDVTLFKPNCTIWIGALKCIDPTYNHVYAIEMGEEQEFLEKILNNKNMYGDIIATEKCTPVRDEREGYVRLPFKPTAVYTANYLIWKNDDDLLPVYAFIDDIKWVNVNCVAIKASIDVFRTYLSRIQFRPCIMERSHYYQGSDEKIGANLYDEPVSEAVYYKRAEFIIDELKNLCAVMYTLPTGSAINIREFGSVFTQFNAIKFSQPFNVSQIASTMQGQSGRVQSFVLLPDFMVLEGAGYPQIITKTFKYPSRIESYTPRNKKLLTFPYIFHEAVTPSGQKQQYRLELTMANPTEGADIEYKLAGLSTAQDNKLWFYPNYYNGYIAGGEYPNLSINEGALTFTSFPELPVSSASWEATINNGSIFNILSGLCSTVMVGGSMASVSTMGQIGRAMENGVEPSDFSLSGAASAGLLMVAGAELNAILSLKGLQKQSSQVSGGSTGLADFMTGNAPFTLSLVHITEDYAKTLDNFFDVYGYRDPNLRTVNIKLRPHWCYWKSTGICAFGFQNDKTKGTEVVPAWAIREINLALMNGVTFWNTDDVLGDYKNFEENHADV